MYEDMHAWFGRIKHHKNSMLTTEILHCDEGDVQLKWWSHEHQLIVKTVALKSEFCGKGIFTRFCYNFLLSNVGVTSIKLESVIEDIVLDKLGQLGWKLKPHTRDMFLRIPN